MIKFNGKIYEELTEYIIPDGVVRNNPEMLRRERLAAVAKRIVTYGDDSMGAAMFMSGPETMDVMDLPYAHFYFDLRTPSPVEQDGYITTTDLVVVCHRGESHVSDGMHLKFYHFKSNPTHV